MDMGIKGAQEFKKKYSNAIFVYIIPPSQEALLNQMKTRNPSRLQRSIAQLPLVESVCNWLVLNDTPKSAAQKIERIMHTVMEYGDNLEQADEETIRFLFEHNMHNQKNKDFLRNFYTPQISERTI